MTTPKTQSIYTTPTYRAAREACRKRLDELGITNAGTRNDKMDTAAEYAAKVVAGTWKYGTPRKDDDGLYALALDAARKAS